MYEFLGGLILVISLWLLAFCIGGTFWTVIGVYLINPVFVLSVTAKQWFVGGALFSLILGGLKDGSK